MMLVITFTGQKLVSKIIIIKIMHEITCCILHLGTKSIDSSLSSWLLILLILCITTIYVLVGLVEPVLTDQRRETKSTQTQDETKETKCTQTQDETKETKCTQTQDETKETKGTQTQDETKESKSKS